MKKSLLSLVAGSILLSSCAGNEPTKPELSKILSGTESTTQQTNSSSSNTGTPLSNALPIAQSAAPTNNQVTTSNTVAVDTHVVKLAVPSVNSAPVVANKVNIAENYNTENVLVGIKSEADLNSAKAIGVKNNLKFNNFIKGINTIVFKTNGQNVKDLIPKLSSEKLFSYVETDHMSENKPEAESDLPDDSLFNLFAAEPVNDKYFKDQYGLTATKVVDAWALSTGKNTIISIIDSGVEMGHQDLKNRVVPGYDAFSQQTGEKAANASKLNYINSAYKHGSHVAGIAAAEYNNGKGIAGVAPEAKILPVKIFPDFSDYFKALKKNEDGSEVTVVSAIADGIAWSVEHHADVINMSLAVWAPSATIERAVKYALDNNVSVVVAAGNDRATGNKKNYLAAIPGVIGVGATDKKNDVTFFSNSGDYVSIVAPGLDIVSTTPSILSLRPYRKMSGTSMSAPHIAGVVALLKSKFGATATPAWIKSRLESTATDLGATGRDDLYGMGLVNAFKALNDPTTPSAPVSSPSPSVSIPASPSPSAAL
jgi:serine protease